MSQWDELVSIMQQPTSAQVMQQAAVKFQQVNLSPQSQIMFCTLGNQLGYPRAIPIEQLPQHIATNPQVYELVKKIVLRGAKT